LQKDDYSDVVRLPAVEEEERAETKEYMDLWRGVMLGMKLLEMRGVTPENAAYLEHEAQKFVKKFREELK
jgi:hypothetical protein